MASSSDGSHVVKFRMIVSSDVTEDEEDDDRAASVKSKAIACLGGTLMLPNQLLN